MFNIKDLVKYRTPMNPKENWGIIAEVLIVKDSIYQETKGIDLYRINPLDKSLGYDFIEEKNVIQVYSLYYEENKE